MLIDFHCQVCQLEKHHRVPFRWRNNRLSYPFTFIYIDVWGASQIINIIEAHWFVSFIDDCSHVTWLYFLKIKFDVSSVLSTFHKIISTQFGVQIKTIRFDNKNEFFNQVLSCYLEREGIKHESLYTDATQQNGVEERKIHHLLR